MGEHVLPALEGDQWICSLYTLTCHTGCRCPSIQALCGPLNSIDFSSKQLDFIYTLPNGRHPSMNNEFPIRILFITMWHKFQTFLHIFTISNKNFPALQKIQMQKACYPDILQFPLFNALLPHPFSIYLFLRQHVLNWPNLYFYLLQTSNTYKHMCVCREYTLYIHTHTNIEQEQ